MSSERSVPFLREFLRNPVQVGTVTPSSRFLEQRLLHLAEVSEARFVVELGPGTGGTTDALLRAMPFDARLLAIELSPDFATLLEQIRDPRLIVHEGSAADVAEIVAAYHLGRPEVILSGIPFSTLPQHLARRILRSGWEVLAPGGRFVAYQARRNIERLVGDLFGEPVVETEFLNVPPVRVYRWDKPLTAFRELDRTPSTTAR